MAQSRVDRIHRALVKLRQGLDELERVVGESEGEIDTGNVVQRRKALLTEMHRHGGMDRETLWPLLRKHKAQPQWVSMQVKAGLVAIYAGPDGRERYSVTPRAIKSYGLDDSNGGLRT